MPDSPSATDIKKLFAESGNCCAFPKCTSAIVFGKSVLGEVCHIKAKSPGGPRFDNNQLHQDRHGFDNLILLCPNHHKVIDDDELSYTVERLIQMKQAHTNSSIHKKIDPLEKSALSALITEKNSYVAHSGGISAHTVSAENITINAAPKSSDAANAKAIHATEILWNSINELKSRCSELLLVHRVLTPAEIADVVARKTNNQLAHSVLENFSSISKLPEKMNAEILKEAELQRPFVKDQLFFV